MPAAVLGFDVPLFPSTPFYEGLLSSTRVPFPISAAIGGHEYLVEPSLFERITIDYQRESRDQSNEPGEQTLTQRGAWKRPARDWRFGAGQDYWDRPESDRARFRSSKGIDILSDDYGIQLLNDTRLIVSTVQTNLCLLSVTSGATPYLYLASGAKLWHTTNPDSASPTLVDSGVVGTVVDLTTDGNSVFAAISTDIKKTTIGGTTETTLSAYDATLVEYANGRLFAAKAGELVEVDTGGATTVVKTHSITSFNWTCIAGAPDAVYFGGNAGDRSEIFAVGFNSSTGGLTPATFAASLPDGEKILSMQFYNGFMVLGTSLGVRLATLGDRSLQYGPLLEVSGGVSEFELQGEDCWFGWTNYDSVSTGLGRLRLSRFTFPMVPVYVSDLMAGSSGATVQGAIQGVVTWGNKRYFSVSGKGVYAEYTDKVPSGSILSGFIEFTVDEPKTMLSVDLRHAPLHGTVDLSVIDDSGTELAIASSILAGSLGPRDPLSMPTLKTEAIEMRVTLNRDASTHSLSPLVKRWTLRAVVNPRRIDEWTIPVWLTETLDAGVGEGVTITGYDPLTEFLYLKDLEASGAPARLQLGKLSFDIQIYAVELPKDDNRRWTDDRDFLQGLCIVHAVTAGAV